MYPHKNYLYLIITFVFIFGINKNSFSQSQVKPFNPDSSKTITLAEFRYRVKTATELLKTKQLSAIADTDHINIMMCLNTIAFTHDYIEGQFKNRFTTSQYKDLEAIANKKDYSRNIIKVYPKWVPNRGMGYYFPQLKMELYGTPMLYAKFNVSE